MYDKLTVEEATTLKDLYTEMIQLAYRARELAKERYYETKAKWIRTAQKAIVIRSNDLIMDFLALRNELQREKKI